jgi:hypothetical protein
VVEVEWRDAHSDGGWASRDEYEACTASVVRSVGYVLKRGREALTLVQSQDQSGEVCDSITIPLGCVRRVRRLR